MRDIVRWMWYHVPYDCDIVRVPKGVTEFPKAVTGHKSYNDRCPGTCISVRSNFRVQHMIQHKTRKKFAYIPRWCVAHTQRCVCATGSLPVYRHTGIHTSMHPPIHTPTYTHTYIHFFYIINEVLADFMGFEPRTLSGRQLSPCKYRNHASNQSRHCSRPPDLYA